ncbi:MAG TPA: HEAT repeat domain-containing protein [Terriglobales bacterium]|nr:HEAT repeat domain-containing protein [Terriglobales bacterium]
MHTWEGNPAPKPTPDYGTLGPGSDVQAGQTRDPQIRRVRVIAVLIAAALSALLFAGTTSARAAWSQIADLLSLHGQPKPASLAILSEHEIEHLDQQNPQNQAQLLLGRSINHYDGANDQIAARVDGWRGRLRLTSQLNGQITTGMNSNDLRVRAAAIEVDLAALNQAKTSANVDRLAKEAESGSQQQRIWALWTLGLLGNRGVEPQRVSEILTSQLRDSDPEIRHWAVEGLAYLGTDDSIAPLLETFHDDPSPMVRERAACSLAQSGMLTQEQRRTAVPKLLDYAEDTSLDAQTHLWVYHALRDITGQNLPSDPAAWRNWYSSVQN